MKQNIIIKDDLQKDVIPLACPVCNVLLRNLEDEKSYQGSLCCSRCELKWVYPNRSKWQEGWRPTAEEIKSYLNEQNTIFINL